MYHRLFAAVLSRLDAERAHRLGFALLRAAYRVPGLLSLAGARTVHDTGQQVRALGLTFPGPLGIAAGFDKNARGVDALAAVGFSFVEVGTVTGQAQPGNPRPRLFRLVDDRAVVNRMGFNNDGAAAVAERLAARKGRRRRRGDLVIGVNIGKTKAVASADAITDYERSARLLAPLADYLVVNVSSPNTPGLRDLQAVDRLRPLLVAVREAADTAAGQHVPLLVKIAPDLSDDEVVEVARLAVDVGLDGVVAVNTTVHREGLRSPVEQIQAAGEGGLSGAPLQRRAVEVLRLLRQHLGTMPIISVGGVSTADDVVERLAAGAALVQAYTAFVYEGPTWPGRIQQAVAAHRAQDLPADG